MADISRNEKYEPLVKNLTTRKHPETNKVIFPTIMDLLIFSAMVGFRYSKLEPIAPGALPIPIRIFENNRNDIFIYILALVSSKQMDLLRVKNEEKMYSTFEQYANGGLSLIQEWMEESPSDTAGDRVLIKKIREELESIQKRKSSVIKPEQPDIQF